MTGRRLEELGNRELGAEIMKALDYAIRTENWELAALCLVVGAMEALEMLPRDAVDEMLAELEVDKELECSPRRHERLRGKARGG